MVYTHAFRNFTSKSDKFKRELPFCASSEAFLPWFQIERVPPPLLMSKILMILIVRYQLCCALMDHREDEVKEENKVNERMWVYLIPIFPVTAIYLSLSVHLLLSRCTLSYWTCINYCYASSALGACLVVLPAVLHPKERLIKAERQSTAKNVMISMMDCYISKRHPFQRAMHTDILIPN